MKHNNTDNIGPYLLISILGGVAMLFFNAWFFDFSVLKTVDGSIVGLSTEMSNWMEKNKIITAIVILISIVGGFIALIGAFFVFPALIVIGIIALFISLIGSLITEDIFSIWKPLRFIGWNVGMFFICLFLVILMASGNVSSTDEIEREAEKKKMTWAEVLVTFCFFSLCGIWFFALGFL